MAHRHKNRSTSLTNRDSQIKTTVTPHYICPEWLLSNRQQKTSVGEYVEKGKPYALVNVSVN